MFQMIRAGSEYKTVVIVSPYDANPDTPGAKVFVRRNWPVGDLAPDVFHEVSVAAALIFFSGHTDHLGFAELPTDDFASIEAVEEWIKSKAPIQAEV